MQKSGPESPSGSLGIFELDDINDVIFFHNLCDNQCNDKSTLETVALVAVARGEAVADGGGGKEAGDEDVTSRGGPCLGGVGGELRRVGVVEGVLLDGQGEGKSRNGEEQKEAHHTGSSPKNL